MIKKLTALASNVVKTPTQIASFTTEVSEHRGGFMIIITTLP